MLNTYTRPMTEAERDEVAELLLRHTKPSRSLASHQSELYWRGFGFVVLSIATAILVVKFLAAGNTLAMRLTILIAIVIAIALLDYRKDYGTGYSQKWAAQLAQRLVRNEAEVTEVTATEVVCIKHELEEEFVSFLFDIGDNQVIYFEGEDLSEEDNEDGTIPVVPRDTFEIVRYPDAPHVIVRIDFKGNQLPVSRTITWTDFAPITDFSSGEIITGVTLATIEQDRPDLFGKPQEDIQGLS